MNYNPASIILFLIVIFVGPLALIASVCAAFGISMQTLSVLSGSVVVLSIISYILLEVFSHE